VCEDGTAQDGSRSDGDEAAAARSRRRALGMALQMPPLSIANVSARMAHAQEEDGARIEVIAERIAECDADAVHALLGSGTETDVETAAASAPEDHAATKFAAALAAWQRRPAFAQGLASCCPHCAVVGPKLPWPSPVACRRRQAARRAGDSATTETAPARQSAAAGEAYAKQLLRFPRDAALEVAVAGVVERRIAASARLRHDCCALQVRSRAVTLAILFCAHCAHSFVATLVIAAPAQGSVPSRATFARPWRGNVRQLDAIPAATALQIVEAGMSRVACCDRSG